MVKLALRLPPYPSDVWTLAVQLGIEHVATQLPRTRPDSDVSTDKKSLLWMTQRFAEFGFTLDVVERSRGLPMDGIKLGLPSRDREIDNIALLIQNMGALGISIFCYDWMAAFSWVRTSSTTPTRGGALTRSFDNSLLYDAPPTEMGEVSEERLWDTLAYFLEKILPVAEESGVRLAIHPDDPPVSPIRGIGRIITSVEALDRVIDLNPSPNNGITHCQAAISITGADIPKSIEHFSRRERLFYAHFRNVEGNAQLFTETFHDEGNIDMVDAMQAYIDVGFDGLMRPDSAPMMYGDPNDSPGYASLGRIYAVGYMRGLLEALSKRQKS